MRRLLDHPLLPLVMLAPALAVSGLLALGFLNRLHPAFDSIGHFRAHLAVALILASLPLLLMPLRLVAATGLAFGIAALATTSMVPLGPLAPVQAAGDPAAGPARYRLLQINLRFDNPDHGKVLSLIGRVQPDVITMDEASDEWQPWLDRLRHAYPYGIICPAPSYIGGVALLSRRPLAAGSEPRCAARGSLALAKVDFGGQAVDVVAMHLGWPWPFEQKWNIIEMTPELSGLSGLAILAGDFNAATWSNSVAKVAAAGGLTTLQGIGPTWLDRRMPDWLRPLIGLPIDQAMVGGGVLVRAARTLEDVGSDHLPVLMEFSLPPIVRPPEAAVLQARL